MKQVYIKPSLVDHALFRPKVKPIKIKVEEPINISFYVNLLGICIIVIVILYMYNRKNEKEEQKSLERHKIIELNEYIKSMTL